MRTCGIALKGTATQMLNSLFHIPIHRNSLHTYICLQQYLQHVLQWAIYLMCGDRSGCFHHKGRANWIMFIASIYGGEIVEALAISELTLMVWTSEIINWKDALNLIKKQELLINDESACNNRLYGLILNNRKKVEINI